MRDINDVIKVLNQCKIKVLSIYNPLVYNETLRYWAVEGFTEPNNATTHYQVKGYDITKIIKEDSLAIHTLDMRNREATILSKIEELSQQTKDYSKDYSYELYLYS